MFENESSFVNRCKYTITNAAVITIAKILTTTTTTPKATTTIITTITTTATIINTTALLLLQNRRVIYMVYLLCLTVSKDPSLSQQNDYLRWHHSCR